MAEQMSRMGPGWRSEDPVQTLSWLSYLRTQGWGLIAKGRNYQVQAVQGDGCRGWESRTTIHLGRMMVAQELSISRFF